MNNKIKLAVAGAVLSAASVANAGIVIPAGDWTLDINGNVNAFATWQDNDKTKGNGVEGRIAGARDIDGESDSQDINTGLLPAWLGFTGTTRQNDVDVSFTISFQPNVSDNSIHGDAKTPLNRQSFITFGDKSWGTVKLGKDLGVFAGQAILNDMTLLGVGGGSYGVSGAATTFGGIGTGYIYPAWKGQISYTTPNMNGFTATIAIVNPNGSGLGTAGVNATTTTNVATNTGQLYQDRFGIEGQIQYEWTGDIAGKVWASGASYDVTADTNATATIATDSYTASAFDIGASITSGNLAVVAYYYDGNGAGTTTFGANGAYNNSGDFKKRDSDGGYLQATYVIPTGTKLGVAYGVSNLDKVSEEDGTGTTAAGSLVDKNERWTLGAYHPLTKHLNLVAEYNKIESEGHVSGDENESDSLSLGAILFF
jgi:predicted porin